MCPFDFTAYAASGKVVSIAVLYFLMEYGGFFRGWSQISSFLSPGMELGASSFCHVCDSLYDSACLSVWLSVCL